MLIFLVSRNFDSRQSYSADMNVNVKYTGARSSGIKSTAFAKIALSVSHCDLRFEMKKLTICFRELRQMFQYMRQLVERRFEGEKVDLRWQSVSAFCFLRFLVPAILHPHIFGLCQGKFGHFDHH